MSTKKTVHHKYTEAQIDFLKVVKLPKYNDIEAIRRFAQDFENRFKDLPDWTPIGKPESLLAKAKLIRSNAKKFEEKVDIMLLPFVEKRLTQRALDQIRRQINLDNAASFTEKEILDRIQYLAEYMEIPPHQILEKEKPIAKVTPPTKKFQIRVGGEIVWSGDNSPKVSRGECIYVDGQMLAHSLDKLDCELIQSL